MSIIIAATVFGAAIFSVSATEEGDLEENVLPCDRFQIGLLKDLTEEQQEIIKLMIEENQAQIKENREEIKAQLEEWGIEVPILHQGPKGFLEDLTEEQKEELKTMKQEFTDAIKEKLEAWGVEVPEFDCIRLGKRGPGRFDMVKP